MRPAVPVVGHGEPGRGPGVALLALQGAPLMLLCDVGRDHVEDASTEHPQGLRVVVARRADQVSTSLRHDLGVDQLGRQRINRVDHHRGLVLAQ